MNYDTDPTARVINETTAVIVENEIGQRVLQRYYPELAQPPCAARANLTSGKKPGLPSFDFNKEMRQTRLHTDELLAAGKIEEAESYMEARRVIFVQHGYRIRKLNQALLRFLRRIQR